MSEKWKQWKHGNKNTIKIKKGTLFRMLESKKKTGSVDVNSNSIDVKLGENKKNLNVFFCRRPKNENLIHFAFYRLHS